MLYRIWNCSEKPDCCDVIANENDLLLLYGGLFFLIQTENDANNVICYRYKKSKTTFLNSILFFRKFCIEQNIHYIKVIGNNRRYFFLKKLEKILGNEGYTVIQDTRETERNLFYIRLDTSKGENKNE